MRTSAETVAAIDRIVDRGTHEIFAQAIGDGVPILLLHQALGSFRDYDLAHDGALSRSLLARGCRVIGFDLAGHGRSTPVDGFGPNYLDLCVEDAVAVLETFSTRRAGVLGIGFGGLVALALADRHPSRIRCVLADSVTGLCPSVAPEPWKATATPEIDPTGPDAALALGWRRFVAALSRSERDDPRRMAPGCPVLITVPEQSAADSCADLPRFIRSLPAGTLARLPVASPPTSWFAARFFLLECERFFASYA